MYWFPHTSQLPSPPTRKPDKGVVPCQISWSWSDNVVMRCTTQTLGLELESSGLEDEEAHTELLSHFSRTHAIFIFRKHWDMKNGLVLFV